MLTILGGGPGTGTTDGARRFNLLVDGKRSRYNGPILDVKMHLADSNVPGLRRAGANAAGVDVPYLNRISSMRKVAINSKPS